MTGLPFNPQTYAKDVAAKTTRLLELQKLLPIRKWVLAEEPDNRVWLFAVLEEQHYPNLSDYCDPALVRKLEDVLQTYVHVQNRKRYAILLGERPTLPKRIEFPEGTLPSFSFGVGLNGPVWMDPGDDDDQFTHIIGAGTTGSGKSNYLQSLAVTAFNKGWSLYLADPEGHTFPPDLWDGIATIPVILDIESLEAAIVKLWGELDRRSSLFTDQARNSGGIMPRDLDVYNDHADRKLPRIFFLLDEANSFADKNTVPQIKKIVQRGRKWGLHIAMFGQNWHASDVPKDLQGLFSTRLCFRVGNEQSGQVVLGAVSWGKKAMRLKEKGRAILYQRGQRYQYVQTYLLPDERLLESLRPHMALPDTIEPWQVELVQYADKNLEGFIVNKLADAFRNRYLKGEAVLGEWSIRKLAENWERCGWLEPDRHATDCRKLTPELRRLAGLEGDESLTGSQGT